MTIQEAIATGNRFTRPSFNGSYYETFLDALSDETAGIEGELALINATDYVVESEDVAVAVAVAVTLSQLELAWNDSRPTGGTVAEASKSAFFKRLSAKLVALSGESL